MEGPSVRIQGRILYITEDSGLLERQLDGSDITYDAGNDEPKLMGNISTDELTPGWVCYYYDETLARFCLVGLRGGKVGKDAVARGGFGVIVSASLTIGSTCADARKMSTMSTGSGMSASRA